MHIGQVVVWERTFTEEEVRLFGALSGDEGVHHIQPDAQGRLMVQGLLTATLPTKIGGDLNVITREMNFQFLRPVFAGDTIRCEVTLKEYEPGEEFDRIVAAFTCANQAGKPVLAGHAAGIIRDRPPGSSSDAADH